MFCTNCGNQLPDGTKFCIHCGTPQNAEAPAAEQPVYTPEPEIPVSQQPLAENPIPAEPVAEEPVYEVPAYEAPVYEAPAYEAPVYAEPAVEVPTYADPVPAPKKKKKKTGLIVAIVLVVALVIGGGVGGFLWWSGNQKSEAYDEAVAYLEEGNLDEALTAFEDLGDYEDAEEYVENITAYKAAQKLMSEHKYDEAAKAFKDLGDFHDSKTYADGGVLYAKATYFMECAAKADPAALELMGEGDVGYDSEEELSILLYTQAAVIYDGIRDYQDAADQYSHCWLEIALIYMEAGDFESAAQASGYLNEADMQAYLDAQASYSADAAVLAAMEETLITWYDADDFYSTAEEVEAAYDILVEYDGAYIMDEDLEDLYYSLLNSLDAQLDTVDSDGYIDDWVLFYEGMAEMYRVAAVLYEDYGVLEGTELDDYFVVYADEVALYPMIEESMNKQFYDVTAPYDQSTGKWYVEYTNDTGYDLYLYVGFDYYLGNTFLEYSDYEEHYVAAGDTVKIYLDPPTLGDDDWDGWIPFWYFNIA